MEILNLKDEYSFFYESTKQNVDSVKYINNIIFPIDERIISIF